VGGEKGDEAQHIDAQGRKETYLKPLPFPWEAKPNGEKP
jgi:hypothetical protein